MAKSIKFLIGILILTTLITSLFGSKIRKYERFTSYTKATCNCPPGYTYSASEASRKRCLRKNSAAIEEDCTCPEKYVYDGPAAADTRCYKE
jgi:hypothetical protein